MPEKKEAFPFKVKQEVRMTENAIALKNRGVSKSFTIEEAPQFNDFVDLRVRRVLGMTPPRGDPFKNIEHMSVQVGAGENVRAIKPRLTEAGLKVRTHDLNQIIGTIVYEDLRKLTKVEGVAKVQRCADVWAL